ncbi:MAG: hypothetical protein JO213_14270 [Alphaproteobacteria bacterium]|nr:hypothetical protein [Alphaproteobacteria bacterium]MBV9154333.1 hypothetical protein [Alphaproteobacteria bacterium]MBV9586037.1 hypothetical protein [Alphaproteobacteria bacterium]
MPLLAYLLARFSEPSSYAGLGAVLALLGVHFSDSVTGQLAQILAAFCALAALLLKERGVIKSLVLIAGLAALTAATACQQIAGTAAKVDPELAAACDAATALSPLAGPYAVWIDAGCGTAEAIAKLAQDPSSAAWVNGLIAGVQNLRAARN